MAWPLAVVTEQSYTHSLYEQILRNRLAVRQLASNQRRLSAGEYRPLATVQNIEPFSRRLYRTLLWLHLLLLVKYVLIEVLAHSGLLDNVRWIDCFMLGRFRFVGRTNKISGWMAIWALVTFLCMQSVNAAQLSTKFRFHFIEFLWHNLRDVLRFEAYGPTRNRLIASGDQTMAPQEQCVPSAADNFNPLFHIRTERGHIILRPNRSAECWLKMDQLNRALFFGLATSFLVWCALLTFAIGGSIFTGTGFELAYSSCARWLRDQQKVDKAAFAYIYRTPLRLADELPFEKLPTVISIELPAATAYNLVRIVVDLAENYLIYVEFTWAVWSTFYLVICSSIDVINNAEQIKPMLSAAINRFNGQRSVKITPLSVVPTAFNKRKQAKLRKTKRQPSNLSRPPETPSVEAEGEQRLAIVVEHLQAVLVDHFELIRSYNTFVSYILNLPIGCWISYTLIICIWMSRIKHLTLETEFKMAQIGALFCTFSVMSSAVIVRSHNRALYPLIASLMALDDLEVQKFPSSMNSITKYRWITIMKYYAPKPTFCFTLFNSTQVSWLFCLKVSCPTSCELAEAMRTFQF